MDVFNTIIESDMFTKVLLLVLAFFSLASWGIIINRFFGLSSARNLNTKFLKFFLSMTSIKEFKTADEKLKSSSMGKLGSTGFSEYNRILSDARQHKSGVTDWSFYLQNQFFMAQEQLETESGRLARKQDWGLYLLAVISSASPFLGLLGTVWGIMQSFYSIGEQGSASLQTVAPGIAAALITTVVGLLVAIPAVIFYNVFIHKVERIQDELDEFSDRFMLRLKKELFNMLYANNNTNGAAK